MSENQNKLLLLTFTLKTKLTRNSLTYLNNLSRALPNKHFEASAGQALEDREQLFLNLVPLPLGQGHLPMVLLTLFAKGASLHRAPLNCFSFQTSVMC